jgi:hypothetical protein
MARVRFWVVDGDDVDADGGYIEVLTGGLVRLTSQNEWMLDSIDGGGTGLPAPEDLSVSGSPTTRPANGFLRIGVEDAGTILYRAEPVDGWDGTHWLDRLRYHFRTPYLRPGEVEFDTAEDAAAFALAIDRATGRIDTHVNVDEPNDDIVDPVDYWFATDEGWENIPPERQAELLRLLGVTPDPASRSGGQPEPGDH